MNEPLSLTQLQQWHEEDQFQKIVDAIESLPAAERTYDLICQLARAYNNLEQYSKAAGLLFSVQKQGAQDPLWHYRLGYALYYLDQDAQALEEFLRAQELSSTEDEDIAYFINCCQSAIACPLVRPFTERVQDFWSHFMQHEQELREKIDRASPQEVMDFAGELLKRAFEKPYFELGHNGQRYELILTGDGEQHRFFKLEYWRSQAPDEALKHWAFPIGRQPCANPEQVELRMHGVCINAAQVLAWLMPNENGTVQISLYSEPLAALLLQDEQGAYSLASILLDQCVGEVRSILRVQGLKLLADPPAEAGLRLSCLAKRLDGIFGEEAADPCASYTSYSMQPQEGQPYRYLREDIVAGTTSCPEIINAYYSADDRIMEENQRDGVIFGFLYYPHDDILQSELVSYRSEMEEGLARLIGGCAKLLGGATGQDYSYIDCVCYDLRSFLNLAVEFFEMQSLPEVTFHVFRKEASGIELIERENEDEDEGEGEDSEEDDLQPELYTEEELMAVEEHIDTWLGECKNVFHELVSPDLHIDLYLIEPSPERNFYTVVTCGMGAHCMNVPQELESQRLERAELLLCLPPYWQIGEQEERWYWPLRWLKQLARLPGEESSWLGWGHTIAKEGKEPFAPNTRLCGAMLITPCFFPEEAACCDLPDGEVNFYQVLPLYPEEMEYKLKHGAEALLDLFDDDSLRMIQPDRTSRLPNH